MADTNPDRAARVVAALLEHLEYARQLAHDLINSFPDAEVTAIAAEQSVEMDLRHAVRDATLFAGYLPKDGGAF